MEDYRQIVAGMYARHHFKQCIGTTAYIQFMENHNASFGSDHCFKYIMGWTKGGVSQFPLAAFPWYDTKQGHVYWLELARKWRRYVVDNGIDRKLSYILENTEMK